MIRSLFEPLHRLRAFRKQEDGNVLAFAALAMVALIGVVSLVFDIGFTVGQRRFMQNGADAAALAVARQLADSVSPYPASGPWPQGIPHYFNVSDAAVRATGADIAERNQNPGITGRTTNFTVTIEYCVAASDSTYSIAAGCPSPNSWVSSPTPSGQVPDGTYKVRVTVTSTITTFFGSVIGHDSTTTNGQAIAVIRGVCPETVADGGAWAFTLWDQQDFGTDPDALFMLWGSANPPAPPGADANWKNVIDLSPESRWCDGVPADYAWAQDPTMAGLVPEGIYCTPDLTNTSNNFAGEDVTWNRGAYSEDPRGSCYTGDSINPDNLATWTSSNFGGTLAVGMKVPLYPQSGDGGNNVSSAIYGPSGDPCSGTYFFEGVTAVDPAHPGWGRYRDVVVFTYDVPTGQGGHFYKLTGNASTPVWTDDTAGHRMGRVTLMRMLHFRIYENYDPAASRVYGRVVSPVFPPGDNFPLCGSGPGIYGNVVQLGA
jgi:Flp pilus assembly protein TadG